MKIFITVLSSGILVLYPFAIYFGLTYFSMSSIALLILLILFIRLICLKNSIDKMPWLLPATFVGAASMLVTLCFDSFIGFKLYPLMVNFAMFAVFSYSYFRPPSVIETFARIKEKHLTAQAINYTAKVTLIWCAFFVVNGLISVYTALYSSLETWLLYNGFISYLLMATLMGTEFLVRLKVKKQHQQNKLITAEIAENSRGMNINE